MFVIKTLRHYANNFNPSESKFESQREAIAPVWYVDKKATLLRRPNAGFGRRGVKNMQMDIGYNKVNVEPGEYFQFQAYCTASKVDRAWPQVFLPGSYGEIKSGEPVGFIEYPVSGLRNLKEGWSAIEQLYKRTC